MAYKNVFTGLDASRIARIMSLLDQLEAELRFTIKLKPAERSSANPVGKRRKTLLEKAIMWARQFPLILPGFRNINEFERMYFDYTSLLPVKAKLSSLSERLSDTVMQIGSNNLSVSLSFYENVKEAMEANEPSTEVAVNELSEFFYRSNGEDVIVEDEKADDGNKSSNGGANNQPLPETNEAA